MATYTRMVLEGKDEAFKCVEAAVPELKDGEVLVRVEACGVCHSDSLAKDGRAGVQYPRAPGHEVVGIVEKLGPNALRFKVGDRVGRGWHGSHCFQCQSCLRGKFIGCDNTVITGLHVDGGYATHMIAPWESLAKVPDGMAPEVAAPLLCAGLTMFNSLRNTGVKPPATVAVQGIGGLGHLGLQYAAAMGYNVVALSRGVDKKELALKLGASTYIDTTQEDVVAALQAMGGADVIMCTAFNSDAMSALTDALALDGQLIVLGESPEPMKVAPATLLGKRRHIRGWSSGVPIDAEDTLTFSALHNIQPMVEVFPLSEANEAYAHMLSNNARFRVVLKP
ncbi:alcohol dehydrogenase [Salpingoeca rosetta]|uniref:Alcohol dehydrogenase n=1 Tax=Salpingoeca rosetta (strain ATCC 50818 / BSB-021) TaxID=946362 RepID=F2UCW7_SALR5|nr:alcohol dehydrogenase [Salpingoeca rosetta]EGD74462.1 alcohol dehydrogenase [Salpingoeca rosetta]|eukprot:XP_004992719.1 alcohol dehydrogenase [Salpingoeca rosetta]